jgi:hypothetical protein
VTELCEPPEGRLGGEAGRGAVDDQPLAGAGNLEDLALEFERPGSVLPW